jgi:hypothetical protein
MESGPFGSSAADMAIVNAVGREALTHQQPELMWERMFSPMPREY